MTEQTELTLNPENTAFHVEIDQNRIAVVHILTQDSDANWLPETFVEELRSVIGKVIYQQARAVLFISARKQNFIQGFKPSI